MAGPDLQIRRGWGGGGGLLDPEIRGGGGLKKNCFGPFRTQFGPENKGGPGAPPLDPPLLTPPSNN